MKQNRSPTKSAERRLNESVTYRSRIVSVSISYQSRIDPVSFSYRSRIVLLSSSYHSRFRKRKQYGNDTEMILGGREDEARTIGGGSVVDTWRQGRKENPPVGLPDGKPTGGSWKWKSWSETPAALSLWRSYLTTTFLPSTT